MKLKQIAASVALATALGGMASTATHAATITIPAGDATFTGTFGPFGGFDWASNGSAVATGFTLGNAVGATDTFDIIYWATAVSVVQPNQSLLAGPSAGIVLGEIEYTVVARVTETATCVQTGTAICTEATFDLLSGTFDIYYGAIANANQLAGTGFQDGALILSGTFTPGDAGSFSVTDEATGSGSGSNPLQGVVTFTNNTYINPDLVGTTVNTTLQLGNDRTDGGANPTSSPDGSFGACNPLLGTICFQADANQSFTEAVPEPGSLALFGLGLLGLSGIVGRRRRTM